MVASYGGRQGAPVGRIVASRVDVESADFEQMLDDVWRRRYIIFLSSSPTEGNNKLERLHRADLFLSWGLETKSFV